MKKILLLAVLMLFSCNAFALERVGISVCGRPVELQAVKTETAIYVPVAFLSAIYAAFSVEDGMISVNDRKIPFAEIGNDIMVPADEVAHALGALLTAKKDGIDFENSVKSVNVTDNMLEATLAFDAAYSVYIKDNTLIAAVANTAADNVSLQLDADQQIIRRVRFYRAGAAAEIRCDLGFLPGDFQKLSGRGSCIKIDLSGFDNKAVRRINNIKASCKKDGSCELLIRNGALTDPGITCDVNTGIYTVTFLSGELGHIKPFSQKGLRMIPGDKSSFTVVSDLIREPHFYETANDLVLVFDAPVIKPLAETVITIDPGHGGPESGATYNGTLEKDLNLLNALKAADELRKLGVTVYMTRTDDSDMSLSERGKYAVDHDSDLFISFHINSCGTPNTGTGIETYYHKDYTLSKYFGTLFHGFLAQNNELYDRKVRSDTRMYQSGFGVLRAANAGGVPGILLEAAFINTDYDRTFLFSEEYRNKIAADVVKAVTLYMQKKPVGEE